MRRMLSRRAQLEKPLDVSAMRPRICSSSHVVISINHVTPPSPNRQKRVLNNSVTILIGVPD